MMNRRTFRNALGLGLILAGAMGWWWFEREDNRPVKVVPMAKAPVVSRVTTAPLPPPAPALPEFGTEAFAKMAKERGAAWVAGRNRDAVSLLALWDLTGDETVLQEAAGKYPGNPQVCLAMLNMLFGKTETTDAEKQQWTEHFISADPENPLGIYYQARIAAAKGDTAAALAALEAALGKKGRINHYLRERMIGAKEGLLASGVSLQDTFLLSMAGPMGKASDGLFGIGNSMTGLFKKELVRLKTPGHEEERQNLAELGLRMAEQQRLTQTSHLITNLTANSWRSRFLKEMDPQTEIGNTGRNAAQELELALAEKTTMSHLLGQLDSIHEYRQNAPIEIQGKYADLVMIDGEAAALKYVIAEMNKAKQ